MRHRIFDVKRLRDCVSHALISVDDARRNCFIAGQMLNEIQAALPHGEFQPWIEKHLPEISYRQAADWARASANIVKHLPPPSIEIESEVISVSEILSSPEDKLPAAARKYKQLWLDLTEDLTIRNAAQGIFVDGDAGHRMDRAVNGKTKGGTRGEDRKDWPQFIGVKLKDISGHLTHFKKMTPGQQSETEQMFRASILGIETKIQRGQKARLFKFQTWPEELCRVAQDALRERLKK